MKTISRVSALFIAALLIAMPAYAGEYGKGQCSVSSGACSGRGAGDCDSPCPITNKFMKKAHFFLENKTEIGLSDDQVKAIKALKLEVKKLSVRQCADMQLMMLDLESKLSEDTVDVAGISAMLDQGAAGMTAGSKQTVEAYAKLKAVLTAQQMAKAKEVWASKQ